MVLPAAIAELSVSSWLIHSPRACNTCRGMQSSKFHPIISMFVFPLGKADERMSDSEM